MEIKTQKHIFIAGMLLLGLFVVGVSIYQAFFSPFNNRPLPPADCTPEVQAIIDKYKINKESVVGCESQEFIVDGETVHFIYLTYGGPHDCESGCFYSNYCAIVDNGADYPYSFDFYAREEIIIKIPSPDSSSGYCTYSETCKEELSGLKHIVVDSGDFFKFRQENILEEGKFRACKY